MVWIQIYEIRKPHLPDIETIGKQGHSTELQLCEGVLLLPGLATDW